MEKYNAFILSPRSIPINRATRYPQFSNPIPRRSQVSIDAWENGEGIGRYHAINTRLKHVHSHRDTRRHARVYYHSRIRGIGSGLEIPLTYSIRTYIHDSVQQRNVTIMITRFISTGSKVRSFVRSFAIFWNIVSVGIQREHSRNFTKFRKSDGHATRPRKMRFERSKRKEWKEKVKLRLLYASQANTNSRFNR